MAKRRPTRVSSTSTTAAERPSAERCPEMHGTRQCMLTAGHHVDCYFGTREPTLQDVMDVVTKIGRHLGCID